MLMTTRILLILCLAFAAACSRKKAEEIARTPEESLACSERFAAHLLPAFGTAVLRPVLDRTFPFERLLDAHAHMLSDTQVGKIVLTIP